MCGLEYFFRTEMRQKIEYNVRILLSSLHSQQESSDGLFILFFWLHKKTNEIFAIRLTTIVRRFEQAIRPHPHAWNVVAFAISFSSNPKKCIRTVSYWLKNCEQKTSSKPDY